MVRKESRSRRDMLVRNFEAFALAREVCKRAGASPDHRARKLKVSRRSSRSAAWRTDGRRHVGHGQHGSSKHGDRGTNRPGRERRPGKDARAVTPIGEQSGRACFFYAGPCESTETRSPRRICPSRSGPARSTAILVRLSRARRYIVLSAPLFRRGTCRQSFAGCGPHQKARLSATAVLAEGRRQRVAAAQLRSMRSLNFGLLFKASSICVFEKRCLGSPTTPISRSCSPANIRLINAVVRGGQSPASCVRKATSLKSRRCIRWKMQARTSSGSPSSGVV